MTDLNERLRGIDRLSTPDLWEAAQARAVAGAVTTKVPLVRRLAIIAASLVIGMAAVTGVVFAFRSGPTPAPVTPGTMTIENGDIWVQVGGGDAGTAIWRIDPEAGRRGGPMWTDSRGTFAGTPVVPEVVADDYAFSPDGSRVVFSAQVRQGSGEVPRELFVMNADGTDREQLTSVGAYAGFPAWSPDGTQIVYASYHGNEYIPGCLGFTICPTDLFVIDLAERSTFPLARETVSETTPTWSPDGSMIAFAQIDDGTSGSIVTIRSDGSDRRQLSPHGDISFPSWSPDGERILFLRAEGGTNHVWTVAPDGCCAQHVVDTQVDTNVGRPLWSPEGDSIAFARPYGGVPSLWIADPAGDRPPEKLASWPGFTGAPLAWQPVLATSDVDTDGPSTRPITIPNLVGLSADEAQALLLDLGLVPELTEQPSDDAAEGKVIAADPETGVEVDPGSSVTVIVSNGPEPYTRLPGLDAYRVCRLMVMPGDFGAAGDEVAVFEEEHASGAGCDSSEGFQHVAILRDGRVTALSRRITDALLGEAWRVWPYATPDLNGDGVDEVAVALSYLPGDARRVWFFTLNADGSGIEGIYAPDAEPFTHLIGDGPDPKVVMPPGSYGIYCRMEGVVGRIVTWFVPATDPSTVEWSAWTLQRFHVDHANASTMNVSQFPDADPQQLCGSRVSARDFYPGQAPTSAQERP